MSPPRSNPKNDRMRRDYIIYLKDARQRSPATVEQVRYAIDRFETYTGFKDFATFNKDQALAFKRALLGSKARRSGKAISKATAHHILRSIQEFLAADQEGPLAPVSLQSLLKPAHHRVLVDAEQFGDFVHRVGPSRLNSADVVGAAFAPRRGDIANAQMRRRQRGRAHRSCVGTTPPSVMSG